MPTGTMTVRSPTWVCRVAWLLCIACALASGCSGDPGLPPVPSGTAPVPAGTPAATPGVAPTCAEPATASILSGPTADQGQDLDLQFHWRAATVCQELHPLEQGAGFGPLEKIVVHGGDGHRVLLLLPSQGGAASVARYRVELADAPQVELVAWVTLESSAAAGSDGVEFAVGVGDASADPGDVTLRYERLTRDQAQAGWHAVRFDLSAYRGRSVWLTLAARETGDRSGDWLLWEELPKAVDRVRVSSNHKLPRLAPRGRFSYNGQCDATSLSATSARLRLSGATRREAGQLALSTLDNAPSARSHASLNRRAQGAESPRRALLRAERP